MEQNNNITTGDNGKKVGIISYLTIIGWLIAFFAMHKDKKTELGSYQLRQTLLFHICSFVIYWVLSIIFSLFYSHLGFSIAILNWILKIGLLILWIIGFIGAINGEKKPIPLIGEKAQSLFPTI